jgi:hypothetical protein
MNSKIFVRIFILIVAMNAVPAAFAVTRTLTITAPATVKPGAPVKIVVAAATAATDSEQISFFQAEYSLDGGKNWVPVYAEKVGRSATRPIDLTAGEQGSKILVRSRMAFRGGAAGDVDFAGKPLNWGGSWTKWESPPAKHATINVSR